MYPHFSELFIVNTSTRLYSASNFHKSNQINLNSFKYFLFQITTSKAWVISNRLLSLWSFIFISLILLNKKNSSSRNFNFIWTSLFFYSLLLIFSHFEKIKIVVAITTILRSQSSDNCLSCVVWGEGVVFVAFRLLLLRLLWIV